MNPPTHGVDGFELTDYEFDELTGAASFEYERRLPTGVEVTRVVRDQFVSEEFHARVREERRWLESRARQ